MQNSPQVYTVQEALDVLRVGRTFLYAEIKRGALKARKIGSKTIFLQEDLAKYLHKLPLKNCTTSALT